MRQGRFLGAGQALRMGQQPQHRRLVDAGHDPSLLCILSSRRRGICLLRGGDL